MSVERCTQLKSDLADARQALADKRLGQQAVLVQSGADVTRFANTSVAQIQAHIADLEADFIGLSCPTLLGEAVTDTIPRRKSRRPLRGPLGRR